MYKLKSEKLILDFEKKCAKQGSNIFFFNKLNKEKWMDDKKHKWISSEKFNPPKFKENLLEITDYKIIDKIYNFSEIIVGVINKKMFFSSSFFIINSDIETDIEYDFAVNLKFIKFFSKKELKEKGFEIRINKSEKDVILTSMTR